MDHGVNNNASRDAESPLTKPQEIPPEKQREVTALRAALVFCLAFMCVEIIGGYLSHSLAILTDAAHLLTDVGAFCLALYSIFITLKNASAKYSYGFHRAEVLGTLASVFTIWLLVGAIVLEALRRGSEMYECSKLADLSLFRRAAAAAAAEQHPHLPRAASHHSHTSSSSSASFFRHSAKLSPAQTAERA